MAVRSRIKIRRSKAADEPALSALDAQAWSPRSGFPSVIEAGRQAGGAFFSADNPPQCHLVAESAGVVVGYIRMKPASPLPENAHVMYIAGIAVDERARNQGAATGLLESAGRYATDNGFRKLSLRVLGTNEPAIRLYERLGFVREGTLRDEFLIDGTFVDDVVMARYLA
jgi:ribosomal protein S18 acetylase RimI-like enzyme